MKKYKDYKKEFIAFDQSMKEEDYIYEAVYYNVYFCHLQVMLKHLHETNCPAVEWKWLRGMYKKGKKFMESTVGMNAYVNENALSWTYEEMLHHAAAGERICLVSFEYDDPAMYMPDSEYYKKDSFFYKIRQLFRGKE